MTLHNNLLAMQPFGTRITPAFEVGARLEVATLDQRHKAPWPDFAGRPIYEGDTIRHPSGETGAVLFWPAEEEPGSQWRVDYGTSHVSRLCLQIRRDHNHLTPSPP